jgi:hypothetical protein
MICIYMQEVSSATVILCVNALAVFNITRCVNFVLIPVVTFVHLWVIVNLLIDGCQMR